MSKREEKHLNIRFFAGAAEIAGCEQVEVTVPGDYPLAQAIQSGVSADLSQLLAVSSFLSDGVLASANSKVKELPADQVDVLPPFAGG